MRWKPIVFALILAGWWIGVHEYTHATIMGYYGCENTTIGADIDEGIFYADCLDEDWRMSEAQWVAHSNNEIIGYNVMPFLLILIVVVYNDFDLQKRKRNICCQCQLR